MSDDLIHHYTNINTLALILKNKTIRFNRLDRVDDITEGESFNILKLSEFIFISCWTYDHDESIPQWNMYTERMAVVRISLPKMLFKYEALKIPDKYAHLKMEIENGLSSPIPFEKMITDNYLISPNFINNIDKFGKKVEYVKDYKEKQNDLIEVIYGSDKKSISMAKLHDPTGMACFKDPAWFFQKEFRFVLFILPLPKNWSFYNSKVVEFQKEQLYKGKGPDLMYFDVDINTEILNKVHITTGPVCTEGELILVESLLERYAPKGTLSKSKFEGTIRKF